MFRERATIETKKSHESQDGHEIEVAEYSRQQLMNKSERDRILFKGGCADDLKQVEAMAQEKGLSIENADREALLGLGDEADVAKTELEIEIDNTDESNEKKSSNPELAVEKADIVEVTRDKNFEGSIIIKTKNTDGRMIGYALRKNSQGDLEGNRINYISDGTAGAVYQLHEADLASLDQQGVLDLYEDALMQEKKPVASKLDSGMEARAVEEARPLDEREASKKFLAEERQKLAQEIREQRRLQHERLAALKMEIENANKNEHVQQQDTQYGKISEMLSRVANTIAEKLGLSVKLDEESIQVEKEDIAQLIDASDGAESIKARLVEHYALADEVAKKQFESIQKTVEQTLIRNNVFIVHALLVDEGSRHNANSNISDRATVRDDMNILLALEPSISASSVVPGSKQGLWGGRGVILGGGDIQGVSAADEGTTTDGIKSRNGRISNVQELDAKVSDKEDRSYYNELVVNNPKVFGFFQNVSLNESGQMLGFDIGSSVGSKNNLRSNFMSHMELAKEKGMPLMIMTPDRKLFEFMDIDEAGVVSVGAEITPEQVALGNAGLSKEERKVIGEEIISKNLFRNIEHQKEAKGIVAELDGQENAEVELSRDEYLAYAKDNPGMLHGFPEHLKADKDFMLEIAEYEPVSTYKNASENLQRDMDFIKHVYSLEKKVTASSIYALMPDDLRRDEKIAAIAVENNDIEGVLEVDLADSPSMWEKIVDKLIEKKNPNKLFSRNIGESQYMSTDFFMRKGLGNVNVGDRLITDAGFVQKLNNSYPNFKFEVDDYKHLLVTKLT